MRILPLVLVLLPSFAGAATVNLSNCDLATVQQAVNAAVDGDVLNLPACSVQWSNTLTVNKSITLQGAGMDKTIITDSKAPSGNLIPPMIEWYTKPTGNTPAGFTKLAHLTLHGGSGSAGAGQNPMLRVMGNSGRVLMLGVKLVQTRSEALKISGYVRGVFANGEIHHQGYFGVTARVEHESWGDHNGVSGTGCGGCGDKSWSDPASIGTDQVWVFENSDFYDTTGLGSLAFLGDGWNGMRVVWRFNRIRNAQLGNHGTESGGRFRSARHFEYYRNQGFAVGVGLDSMFATRGGTGMVFDNTLTPSDGGFSNKLFDMNTYRSNPPAGSATRTSYWPWGRCGITPIQTITRSGTTATATTTGWDGRGHWLHSEVQWPTTSKPLVTIAGASDGLYNGTFRVHQVLDEQRFTYILTGTPGADASGSLTMRMPHDGNSDVAGYRCVDQAGAGKQSATISGVAPDVSGITEALEPIYNWNNIYNGNPSHAVIVHGGNAVVANRDFYNQAHPSNGACSVAAFNGTCGIGRGPVASRPASCTPGVAYWATDEGQWDATNGPTPDGRLYKCTAPNTWALFYTPLAYPHPLVTGADVPTNPIPAPAPVQNVRVVVGGR